MPHLPNSRAGRDIAHVLHPYTNLRRHAQEGPLIITEGRGVYVRDEDGRDYLEAMAGLWCTSLGFSEPRLVKAATQAMNELPFYHGFGHRSHPAQIELAERLIAMAPHAADGPMSKVFFANSGSEANDSAIKLVWYYNNARGRPEKKKIISRQRAYHGVTVASASLTGLPNNHRAFDLPIAGILHTECPYTYRRPDTGISEERYASHLADALDALIRSEGPETIAAFIAEPVMGAGGVLVPPRTYFEKIQAVLRRHDVLFIADEVICGFGRTGKMFGCETFDLQPDMITLAKALTSAYLPMSALLISTPIFEEIARQSDEIGLLGHGFTYSGHPVCAAVALETLNLYEERDIVGHVRAVAPQLQKGLAAFADHPLVGDVRGVGLVAGVELVRDKSSREAFAPTAGIGALLQAEAQKNGLLVRALGDIIAFSPPLVIRDTEINLLLDRFALALEGAAKIARKRGLI